MIEDHKEDAEPELGLPEAKRPTGEAAISDLERQYEATSRSMSSQSFPQQPRGVSVDRKIELAFGFIGLVFAGVLAWTAYSQLSAMQAQLTELQKGAADTKRAIDSLEKIALATQSSLDQNKSILDATVENAHSGQRAWVISKGPQIEVPDGEDKEAMWQVQAVWENVGLSPTKGAMVHVSWEVMPEVLPRGFKFPDLGSQDKSPLVLGPKAIMITRVSDRIEGSLLKEIQEHKAHLYVWGWVSYRDIFENTKLHITKFCGELAGFQGNPVRPHGVNKVTFNLCPYHNCTDDECTRHPSHKSVP